MNISDLIASLMGDVKSSANQGRPQAPDVPMPTHDQSVGIPTGDPFGGQYTFAAHTDPASAAPQGGGEDMMPVPPPHPQAFSNPSGALSPNGASDPMHGSGIDFGGGSEGDDNVDPSTFNMDETLGMPSHPSVQSPMRAAASSTSLRDVNPDVSGSPGLVEGNGDGIMAAIHKAMAAAKAPTAAPVAPTGDFAGNAQGSLFPADEPQAPTAELTDPEPLPSSGEERSGAAGFMPGGGPGGAQFQDPNKHGLLMSLLSKLR